MALLTTPSNFVDPRTRVTTNYMEATWRRAKAKFKTIMRLTNCEMVTHYLSEFISDADIFRTSVFTLWVFSLGSGCNIISCLTTTIFCLLCASNVRYILCYGINYSVCIHYN